MRYRNIQIDYGDLRSIHTKLGIYRQAVWQLMDSMRKIHKIIMDSSNLMSVLSLNSLYIVTQNQLQSCYDEMEALYDLLGNYIKEMTALVGAGEGVTQVNRNDVYWNLQFMYGILDEIRDVRLNNPLPTEDGLGKTDAQIQAMKNNYKKADSDILCIAFPSLHTCINDCKKTLKSYYEDKIVEYENTDDAYRKKAKKIRKEYSDEDDRDLQSARDFGNVVTDLFAGAYFTVTELLSAVLTSVDFMLFDGGELLALITMLISPDPPSWTKKLTENEMASYDLLVALLSDPIEVLESLSQQVNDEYDKNGLVFYVGSIVADIAITKGTSKVIKATKAGSVAEDVAKLSDDVPNVEKGTEKIKKPEKPLKSKYTKKILRKTKKKYIEIIDDLVKKMKDDKIPKDISYEDLVAKYGNEYYIKELKAAYSKYTGKKDQLDGIDYQKILEEDGRPVKKGEHAHHIVYKKGLPGKMREIAEKAQDILRKYDIDPVTDPHNLVSAPNKGHSIENIKEVYESLATTEKKALEYCKKKGYNAKKTKQVVKQWLYDELDRLGNIVSKAGR